MIKNLFALIAISIILVSCGGNSVNTENATDEISASEDTQNEIKYITIGEFDTKAGGFVDQEVLVEGIVDHVCKHGGKKLFLVSDEGDLHVEGEERFDESLTGSEIIVKGIVREFRVDEAYCLKMEDDNIQSHKEGDTDEDLFEMKKEQIQFYRDSMLTASVDHLSFYSLDYVSHDLKGEK